MTKRKLDDDLRRAMEAEVKKHSDKAKWIEMYYHGAQIERDRVKEYPIGYQVTRHHLKLLDRKGIPYAVHSKSHIGNIEVLMIGFKTQEDFDMAMRVFDVKGARHPIEVGRI